MVTKKQILQRLEELTDFVKSKEYEKLKQDSEELKRIRELLSHIHFKVKEVQYYEENETVQIRYELPVVNLKIDENGNPNKNDFFYSTNVLEMISFEDMEKIANYLERVKLNRKEQK